MTATMTSPIGAGQLVRVINKGPNPLRIKYNRMVYVLEPEVEKPIPWEAAQLWFGDPRTTSEIKNIVLEDGSTQMLYPRQYEVRRLRAKYGNLEGQGDETEIQNAPKVELYTFEGERIYTVLEDPHGDTTNPAITTVAEHATTAAMINKLQRQNEILMDELRKRGGLDEEEATEVEGEAAGLSIQTGDLPTDEDGQ